MQDDDNDGRGDSQRPPNGTIATSSSTFHPDRASTAIGLTDCHFKYPKLEGFAKVNPTWASTWAPGWASSVPTALVSPR